MYYIIVCDNQYWLPLSVCPFVTSMLPTQLTSHNHSRTIKVQFTLEQAMKAQRGIVVYLYPFFNLGA
jgi:hypothetical protein